MNQLLHFVNNVVVLYRIIWDDKYVFLDCIGLLLTAADTIHCLYSMAVQDRNMKRDFVDVKVLSLCFLVLGLCITVFNICAFFLGVTGSACRTLSVPHFFEVLFWNPGDSSVVKKLLSFAFSRCLLTHSLIFSSFFFGCTSLFSDLFCFASFLGFLYGEWAMCLQTRVRFSALSSLFFSFFNQLFPIFFIMYPIFSFFSAFLLSSAIFSRERPWYWLSTLHSLIAWMDTRMYLEDRKCHVFVTLCNTKALNLPYVHPLYSH